MSETRSLVEDRAQIGIESWQQGAREKLFAGELAADIECHFNIEQIAAQQRQGVAAQIIAKPNLRKHHGRAFDSRVDGGEQRGG